MDAHTPKNEGILSEDWYADAFGALYPVVYAHRTVAAAAPEACFAAKAVGLVPDDHALDLCCGEGRHLVSLEKIGAQFTGLDYSSRLLARARQRLAPQTQLVRADMRRIPFAPCFDVVFSFFTSFGYFMEEADNVAAAAEMARVLKSGGRFFMDYLNPNHVARTLTPASRRVSQGYTIEERRWIDETTMRVNKTISVTRDGEVVGTSAESVRLYTKEQLTTLLHSVGLSVAQVWGDYEGADYGDDAARMILTGVRADA